VATRNTHRAHKVRGRRPVRASSVAVSREDGPSKIAAAWHIRVCATVHRACDRTVEHSPRNVGFVLGESGSESLKNSRTKTTTRPKTQRKTRHPDRAPVAVRTSRRPRPPVGPGRPRARPPDLCYTLLHRPLEPATSLMPVSCVYAVTRKIIELNLPTCSCVVTNRGTTRVCPCRNTMSRLSSTTLLLVVRAKYNWSAHTHKSHSEQRLQRTL